MELKALAKEIQDFLDRYRDVKDIMTDPRGIEAVSDFAEIAGCKWEIEFVEKHRMDTP